MCRRTEDKTRKFMYEMVAELRSCDEPFLRAVGYCCMPYCEWYGGRCPEVKGCEYNTRKLSDVVIERFKFDYLEEARK